MSEPSGQCADVHFGQPLAVEGKVDALNDNTTAFDCPRRANGGDARRHALRIVVEFDVPVQVIAPALRRVTEADGDANRRRVIGPLRRTK